MNSARFRHWLSSVYASETRCGSRLFHASSAIRILMIAVSRVKGGTGAAIADLPASAAVRLSLPRRVGADELLVDVGAPPRPVGSNKSLLSMTGGRVTVPSFQRTSSM